MPRGMLWQWTGVELRKAIRSRQISSREAVQSCFDRLDAVNPKLNAVVDQMRDDAFSDADRADAAVKSGADVGVLHGLPVTVKINVDVARRATTNGVVSYRDAIATQDSVPVANLRKAGAIIIGRTNVPAFSTRYFTDNDLHGRTLNPWNADRTPGGSSGGAAAAVAAGIAPISHGNDRAGSIRYPAYACGVFGLRATTGRISDFLPSQLEERGVSSQLANVQGPLARSVDDIRIALEALSARDARDPWWVPASIGRSDKPRVALFYGESQAEPAVSAAVRLAGQWLQEAGYAIYEAQPPRFMEAAELFWKLLMTEEKAASKKEVAASSSGIENYGDAAVKRARAGTRAFAGELDLVGYIEGLARRSTILREWLVFLQNYPLLVMPVSWQRPFVTDADQQGDEAVAQLLRAQFPLLAISILGLPSLAAPTGLVDGVPMGVQLVAGRFQEDTCLEAGKVLESRSSMKLPIDPIAGANCPFSGRCTAGERTTSCHA